MSSINIDLVDAAVIGNTTETTALAIDHFSRNRLTHFALFFLGGQKTAINHTNLCHQLLQSQPITFSNLLRYTEIEDLVNAPKEEALTQTQSVSRMAFYPNSCAKPAIPQPITSDAPKFKPPANCFQPPTCQSPKSPSYPVSLETTIFPRPSVGIPA